jgi:hypothetical protein
MTFNDGSFNGEQNLLFKIWFAQRRYLVGFEAADDPSEFHPLGRVAAQEFIGILPVRHQLQPTILNKGLNGAFVVKKDGGLSFDCVCHVSPLINTRWVESRKP